MERVLKEEELRELARWSAAIAPSGREESLRAMIAGSLQSRGKDAAATWEVDALGNLVVTSRSAQSLQSAQSVQSAESTQPARSGIAVAAPLDEPGVLVTHIDEDGWLRVELLGELTPADIVGRQIAFQGRTKTVWGVAAPERRRGSGSGARSSEGAASELRADELFVDVGGTSRSQVEWELSPGSAGVVWYGGGLEDGLLARGLSDDRLTGKALGRRSLAYLLYTVALGRGISGGNGVRGTSGVDDISGVSSVNYIFAAQSLLGGRGIQPAVYRLSPGVLIVLQPIPAADWPAAPKGEVRLGGGPVLVIHAGASGSDRQLLTQAEESAIAAGGHVQRWVADGRAATDLSQGAWAGSGVRALGLGLPVRAVAGGPETISLRDWLALRDLLTGLLKKQVR